MWIVGAGFGGLAVAAVLWPLAVRLAPDPRGRPITRLPRVARWALGAAVGAGGAAGATAVAAALPEQPAAVAFILFAAVTPGLMAMDAMTHRLPYAVTGPLAAAMACGFGWDAVRSGESANLERAAGAVLLVGALSLAWWRLADGQLGLGDVALLAVIGGYAAWLSWATVWGGLTMGFALAAVAALLERWRAGGPGGYMPLGPWLLAGCWAAIALTVAT
jgi:hypothetical protein